jgi:membrane protein YqaA with SNARE-associated domain
MFDWINALQAWLQTWMSAEAGLWGLFFSAFV